MPLRRLFACRGICALVMATLLLSGCATRASEALFKEQHTLSTELAYAIFDAERNNDLVRAEKLYDLEDSLRNACGPFQKAAYRKLTEGEVDFELGMAVMGAYPYCYDEIYRVRTILEGMGIRGTRPLR